VETLTTPIAAGRSPCPRDAGAVRIQLRSQRVLVTVIRDTLVAQPPGWLSELAKNWTDYLEADLRSYFERACIQQAKRRVGVEWKRFGNLIGELRSAARRDAALRFELGRPVHRHSKAVAVNLMLPVTVNGSEIMVSWGARISEAIRAAGVQQPKLILPQLTEQNLPRPARAGGIRSRQHGDTRFDPYRRRGPVLDAVIVPAL
jgi:hypothetical protein